MNINRIKVSTNIYDLEDSTARESLASKQDILISGTNIKTINNQSLLGSGNISIQGGGGASGTTLADYGITDAYTKTETDAAILAAQRNLNYQVVTQAEYDALTPDPDTLYIINIS